MPADAAEEIVAEAQRKGDLIGVRMSIADDEDAQDPWTLPPSRKRKERPIEGPLPKTVQIVRANLVYVEKKDLPPAMLNRLLRLAAFQNPEFYKAQAMRLSTYDKPRVIACGQEFAQHIAVPRGCLTETLALLEAHKIRPEVRDERYAGTAIEAEFQGQLRPFQEEAVAKITAHDEGILCAPTAFGKTAVAAWLIAKRKVNTLVVVHRQQLLDQWQERLGMFLDLPAKSIGHIGGGKMDRTGCVDVAVIQSLYRKDEVKDFVAEYGQVIVDECHHISAFTFEQVMRQVKAKYVVGLTATPTRKDGHHPIIYMQCGPVRFSMSARTMTETTPFEHKVTPRHTEFRMAPELTEVTIQDIYAALVNDVPRNEMIANDIVRAVESGRCPLLLTGRTEHLQYFAAKLAGVAKHVFVLKGGMGKKQRRETAAALAAVPENESRVILATVAANGSELIYTDSGVTLFQDTPRTVSFTATPTLVDGANGGAVTVDGVPITGANSPMPIQSGALAGYAALRDTLAPEYQAQLDQIAGGLINAFAESDQSATPTLPSLPGLFTTPGATSLPSMSATTGLAAAIEVNPNVDPSQGGNPNLLRDGGISDPGNPAYTYNTTGAASYTGRIQELIGQISATQSFDPSAGLDSSASLTDYANASVSWLQAQNQQASDASSYQNARRNAGDLGAIERDRRQSRRRNDQHAEPRKLLRFDGEAFDDRHQHVLGPAAGGMTTVGANFVSTHYLANSLVAPVMQAQSQLTSAMTEECRPANTPISACSSATSPATNFRSRSRSASSRR